MSDFAKSVPAAIAHTRPHVTGRDREFLPAALEILESPPPPAPVAFMMAICAFFALALVWAFVGRLDIHAVAPGKIERVGRAKVIEPLDPGRISAIRVAQGDRVAAGDVLFELDPTEARADAAAQSDAANASLAEAARRLAEIDIAQAAQRRLNAGLGPAGAPSLRASLEAAGHQARDRIVWDASIPEPFRNRESAVMSADLTQLGDALDDLDKQMAQKEATRQRLAMSIAFQETLMMTLNDRVNTRQQAIDLSVGTKINLYDAKEILLKSQAALASDRGQLIETDAALRELQAQKTKAVSQFVADGRNKLGDAARKADEARDGLDKANARLAHTRLVSPADGVVQQMAVTTIGQVVASGQELAVIAPSDGKLQVEALVANLDIGFVKPGQEVSVKVDAFPFTRFGVVKGKVVRIAAEAVDEQVAKRSLSDATAGSSPNLSPSGAAPGQPASFVFPITVELDADSLLIDGAKTPLSPGMTVSAEIKTDSRRVIDYLWSPLAKTASEALRER